MDLTNVGCNRQYISAYPDKKARKKLRCVQLAPTLNGYIKIFWTSLVRQRVLTYACLVASNTLQPPAKSVVLSHHLKKARDFGSFRVFPMLYHKRSGKPSHRIPPHENASRSGSTQCEPCLTEAATGSSCNHNFFTKNAIIAFVCAPHRVFCARER